MYVCDVNPEDAVGNKLYVRHFQIALDIELQKTKILGITNDIDLEIINFAHILPG